LVLGGVFGGIFIAILLCQNPLNLGTEIILLLFLGLGLIGTLLS